MSHESFTSLQETTVVALLGRGETYAEIKRLFAIREGRTIDSTTILNIKKRNANNLQKIRDGMAAKAEADASSIKHQANRVIKKQLDNMERASEVLAHAGVQYMNDEIDLAQYTKIAKTAKTATLPELVSVSKEMHTQSGATPNPGMGPDVSAAIRKALEEGDEVALNQLIFKKGAPETPPPKVVDG